MTNKKLMKKIAPVVMSAAVAMTSMPYAVLASDFTDAVNSIPADTDNTQWPEVLADAVPYMKEMSKPYMWAAGLEANPDYKEQIQSELLKLTRLEETSDEFIENLSNMK